MIRALVLVLALAACGSAASTPPPSTTAPSGSAVPVDAPLDHDMSRLAARSVALYQDIVGAFGAAGDNCALATGRLGELARTYADVIDANAKVAQEGRDAALKAALARHDHELGEAAATIMHSSTVAKCAGDAAFGKAWEVLVGPTSE